MSSMASTCLVNVFQKQTAMASTLNKRTSALQSTHMRAQNYTSNGKHVKKHTHDSTQLRAHESARIHSHVKCAWHHSTADHLRSRGECLEIAAATGSEIAVRIGEHPSVTTVWEHIETTPQTEQMFNTPKSTETCCRARLGHKFDP